MRQYMQSPGPCYGGQEAVGKRGPPSLLVLGVCLELALRSLRRVACAPEKWPSDEDTQKLREAVVSGGQGARRSFEPAPRSPDS